MTVPGPSKLFHRFPFVLTDRSLDARANGSSACRLLSIDDSLGEGGVLGSTYAQSLLVEAMAQTAALFAEGSERRQSGMLAGLRRVRFGRPPRVGERLLVDAELVQTFGDLVRVAARVREVASSAPAKDDPATETPGEILAEGEILISLAGGGIHDPDPGVASVRQEPHS